MVSSIESCALVGLEPYSVMCEVDLALQLPSFSLVGLPSSLTQESRERIKAAVTNSGFDWPARRVTVNLLPANLPKWGTHFELAMAIGVLASSFEQSSPLSVFAVGELSLSGSLRSTGWLVAAADWIYKRAIDVKEKTGIALLVLVPDSDARAMLLAKSELGSVCELVAVASLAEAFRAFHDAYLRAQTVKKDLSVQKKSTEEVVSKTTNPYQLLSEVEDEPLGVLAALVALVGRYHVLYAGPHGMGKSMLIRAICQAAAPLTEKQSTERYGIFRSFGGEFGQGETSHLPLQKPVVHLQASVSRAALEGALLSSGQVLPGELTRAHYGFLVSDELLEFRRDVIESLRQPLDEGLVRLQRAKFRTLLPASFQWLASTNLCPCGYLGKQERSCRCAKMRRDAYQAKLSGPLMDRFDLIVMLGQRQNTKNRVVIPRDMAPIVADLLDPNSWQQRVEQAQGSISEIEPFENPAEVWSQVYVRASNRGKLKLARVSRALAALLGEKRSAKHLKLATLLRQDLETVLRGETQHVQRDGLKNQSYNSAGV